VIWTAKGATLISRCSRTGMPPTDGLDRMYTRRTRLRSNDDG
jgi:hypothetical protein